MFAMNYYSFFWGALVMTFLLSIGWLAPDSLNAQDDGWKLKKETEDLRVYYRNVEGSKINELRLETTVDADLNTIVALIKDVDALKVWVYKLLECKKLEKISETEGILYTVMDFPWPFSNRDLIFHAVLTQDPVTMGVTHRLEGIPDHIPHKKGRVRVPESLVSWTFTPIGPNKCSVDYILKSDPGGNIPAWIINMALEQGPIKSMKKFKELLTHEKYRNAKFAFIQEANYPASK